MRLDVYKKIATIESKDDYSDMQDELIDRFGDMPAPVENLLAIALNKSIARQMYVTSITQKSDTIRVVFSPEAPVDAARIPRLITKMNGALILIPDPKAPGFLFKMNYRGRGKTMTVMESMEYLLGELRDLLDDSNEEKKHT